MLIAAAGLADAAWATTLFMMYGGMFVIWMCALLSFAMPSWIPTTIAMVLLFFSTLVFQPWYCFFPFRAEDYSDPDVVAAANDFRLAGLAWVATVAWVAFAVFVKRQLERHEAQKTNGMKSSASR